MVHVGEESGADGDLLSFEWIGTEGDRPVRAVTHGEKIDAEW